MAGTVKSYLAAVRHSQIAIGLGDPHMSDMPQLEYVVKGLKKKTAGAPQRTRLPITPPVMHQLKEFWARRPNRQDAVMLWAASCLCFFGFLRIGEAVVPADNEYDPQVHLNFEDARVNSTASPEWTAVQIKASKTDPFRKGVTIYLGVTGKEVCPVAAMLGYMVQRGDRPGPMFQFPDCRYLTRVQFVT